MVKVQIVERNGQKYEVHSVKAKNGKTAKVETVPFVTTLEELGELIENGIDNEAHIASCYRAHYAVEAQAAARRTLEGGKVPAADRNRLFATMDGPTLTKLAKLPDGLTQVDKHIQELYDAEQEDAENV